MVSNLWLMSTWQKEPSDYGTFHCLLDESKCTGMNVTVQVAVYVMKYASCLNWLAFQFRNVRCDLLTTGASEDYSLLVSRTEQFLRNSPAFRIKHLLPSSGCFLEVETSGFFYRNLSILLYWHDIWYDIYCSWVSTRWQWSALVPEEININILMPKSY
jgi:hypothetical protein